MTDLEPAVTLPWLVRLRWSFVAGQLAVLPVLHGWFGLPISLVVLGVELGVMVASNIALAVVQHDLRWSRSSVIGAVMILDTALWTLLLAGSGGSANPFTVLYLVHITLSAIVLGLWWTWIIAALSLVGFALLFVTTPMRAMHEAMGFAGHLQAMWGAFAVAAVLIAFFVGRVTRSIAVQRQQIANLREANERTERHASVMRLAAGAAHELGSPLATIAVAAHEAKLRLAASGDTAAVVADLELVAHEIERCQSILQRISKRSHEVDGASPIPLAQLADAIRDRLGEQHAHRVDVLARDPELVLQQPRDPLTDSLVALIKNALDATRGEDRVEVELARDAARGITITIADRGDGIREDVLARVGTPFFTTKQAGRGLGLGVFLARAFFESRGGALALESVPGRGTRAIVRLPLGGVA
ncbi:MAG TPA: HAMP domain-containing sensor histidine kinase [Kofleriaceae bacterium]|nr:HAMP domain-containing sensor histidine kinase [Kofleriaceae bacterium]